MRYIGTNSKLDGMEKEKGITYLVVQRDEYRRDGNNFGKSEKKNLEVFRHLKVQVE